MLGLKDGDHIIVRLCGSDVPATVMHEGGCIYGLVARDVARKRLKVRGRVLIQLGSNTVVRRASPAEIADLNKDLLDDQTDPDLPCENAPRSGAL